MRYWSRRPGTFIVGVLTLALGLGAAGTVFAALWSVVLRPLPYRNPNELVAIHNRAPESHLDRLPASPLDHAELSARPDLFSGVGSYIFVDLNRTGIARPEKVNAISTTRGMFDVLQVKPLLGRLYEPREDHVVVISERYWESDFGRDPQILNRSLILDGVPYPVIGVMPSWFALPNEVTQMWVPLTFRPAELTNGKNYYLHTFARLRTGLDFKQASKGVQQLTRDMARSAVPDTLRARPSWNMFLSPMATDDDGSRRQWTAVLFTSVMFLWAIVCWNFASLLLVRWTERRFDLALRRALGASRGRLAGQVFGEALGLAAAGGIFGVLLARTGVFLLSRYGPAGTLRMDAEVYLFCAALPLITAMLAGIYPAWSSTRPESLDDVREAGHQRTASSGTRRWQQGLIVAQVAAATVMLVAGGLLTRNLLLLLRAPVGFDARNLLTAEFSLPRDRYKTPAERNIFTKRVLEEARALPGVEAASACTLLPFGYGENVNIFSVEGRPKASVDPFANINAIMPDYFQTMRIPLLKGRYLTERDLTMVVIDDTLARQFFANEDPIGHRIRVPWGVFEVVGVVGAVKVSALDLKSVPSLYFTAKDSGTIVVRTSREMPEFSSVMAGVVARIDPDQPIYSVFSLEEWIGKSVKTRRFVVWLVGGFAAVGTALASLGVFNLLSFTVETRRREIGIRMAVGASSGVIASWVCLRGVALVAAGLVVGGIASVIGQSVLRSQLYGVRFAEPAVWAGVLGIVGFMGVVACALPAWRAARVNPGELFR